jgi:hypothetical protein
MTEKTRLGLSVLEAALLLGLLGDLLLRAQPWGLNVFLWVGVLVAACFALARRRGGAFGGEARWLLPSMLAFAAAFAWRDSLTLRLLDALALLVLLALFTLRARGGRIRLAGLSDYLTAGVASGMSALFGGLLLIFNDIGWKEFPRNSWSRHGLAVLRGLIIGVPVLLVFGALFVAADAVYEGLVRSTFNFDADVAVSHVLIFIAFAWLSAGLLRTAFSGARPTPSWGSLPAHVAFGFTDALSPEQKDKSAGLKTKAADDFKAGSVTQARDEKSAESLFDGLTGARRDECASPPPSVIDEPSTTTVDASSQAETTSHHVSTHNVSSHNVSSAKASGVSSATTDAPSSTAPGASASTKSEASGSAEGTQAPGRVVSLGVVEVGIVLGLLNVLFMSFVFVQLRYFFGGSEVVLSSADMTYAEYARRGFFELSWVAALVLPLLLAVHWLLRKENPAHERIFRALSGGLLLMLFVIMASAVGRMRLYQSEYGQTELRIYVTAFMGWLALVFVWFALTVLRGERERFAYGALVAALAIVGALHVLNPNALIVRTNATLAREHRVFDAAYSASLGADAVPALLEALPGLRPHERSEVAARLLEQATSERSDWRSWNWSRSRARNAIAANESMLKEWAKQPSPQPAPSVGEAVTVEPDGASDAARATSVVPPAGR